MYAKSFRNVFFGADDGIFSVSIEIAFRLSNRVLFNSHLNVFEMPFYLMN